jgi:hypothetical protein
LPSVADHQLFLRIPARPPNSLSVADLKYRDPLRAVITLDRRVGAARFVLQRTSEAHPEFERRVAELVELVSQRDRVLSDESRPWPPPAA